MLRSVWVLALLLAGCSSYSEVNWGDGVAWEQARNLSQAQIRRLADAVEHAHEPRTLQKAELQPGQPAKRIPNSNRHVVMPGETLSAISQSYRIGLKDVAAMNGLAAPYTIYVGQELWLRPQPQVPDIYVIAAGDTFLGVANRYGLSYDHLRAQNPQIDPESLLIGQTLQLGNTESVAPAKPTHVAKLQAASAAELPSRAASGFLWPVSGNIVEKFGAKPSGIRNDGINIAAAMGATVQAAEAGVVVYAGEAVPAMGRMLMIRHADDYVTAYGHNQALLVTVGDRVSRGQAIAKVGNTGTVTNAQLHFQIRKGKEAVDPVGLLNAKRTKLASSN